jgi:ABC-2 type transport system ATP-binding protein
LTDPSPSPSRLLLEADGLTKRYDDGVLALDHVSFAVSAGQIYAMLGANGAGKTTTINLFLNFIEPTEGEARIDGVVTHREPLRAKASVAFVSEQVLLYPNFTAVQNLEYFARLGGRKATTRDECRDALRAVGLQDDAHGQRLREFSKGMRQKVGLAIAVIKNAPAVLLDEPTSGLDPKAGYEFVRLLATLRNQGKAILMSTHDIFRAREIADVIGIMSRGRLVLQQPAAAFAGQDLERVYLEHMAGHTATTHGTETP